MSSTRIEQAPTNGSGIIRGSQALAAGLTLLALATFALWAMSDLAQGTLSEMGPGMLPRSLAIAVGLCGLALTASAFLKPGERLERWSLRGPGLRVSARSSHLPSRSDRSARCADDPGPRACRRRAARDHHRRLCHPRGALAGSRHPRARADAVLHGAVRRPAQPADPDLPAGLRRVSSRRTGRRRRSCAPRPLSSSLSPPLSLLSAAIAAAVPSTSPITPGGSDG